MLKYNMGVLINLGNIYARYKGWLKSNLHLHIWMCFSLMCFEGVFFGQQFPNLDPEARGLGDSPKNLR